MGISLDSLKNISECRMSCNIESCYFCCPLSKAYAGVQVENCERIVISFIIFSCACFSITLCHVHQVRMSSIC